MTVGAAKFGLMAAAGAGADPAWYDSIATTTLGSDQASVTFAQNFSEYMDLVLITYVQTAATGAAYSYLDTYLNDDTTGANYDRQWLGGDGSSVTAQSTTTLRLPVANATLGANVFGAAVTHFFDVNSDKYKSVLFSAAHDGDGSGWLKMGTAVWKNTAAITEIDLVGWQGSHDIKAGSMFSLFGLKREPA